MGTLSREAGGIRTIQRLDASDVVSGQDKGFGVSVRVNGVHESTGVIRVRQTQRVAELVSRHHEKHITCSPRDS